MSKFSVICIYSVKKITSWTKSHNILSDFSLKYNYCSNFSYNEWDGFIGSVCFFYPNVLCIVRADLSVDWMVHLIADRFLKADTLSYFWHKQMSPTTIFHFLRKIPCNSHLKCRWICAYNLFIEIFEVKKGNNLIQIILNKPPWDRQICIK